MVIVCPCCLKERPLKDTVLWNYLNESYKESHPYVKNIKDDNEFYMEFKRQIDWYREFHKNDQSDKFYHNSIWACNICIDEGKALIGDYSKQTFGLGGPNWSTLILNLNARNAIKLLYSQSKSNNFGMKI